MRRFVHVFVFATVVSALAPAHADAVLSEPFAAAKWVAWEFDAPVAGEVRMAWRVDGGAPHAGLGGWVIDAAGNVVANAGTVWRGGSASVAVGDAHATLGSPVWTADGYETLAHAIAPGTYRAVMTIAGEGLGGGEFRLYLPPGTHARMTSGNEAFYRWQANFEGDENVAARASGVAAVWTHSRLRRTEQIDARFFGYMSSGSAGAGVSCGCPGHDIQDAAWFQIVDGAAGAYAFGVEPGQGFVVGNERGVVLIGADVVLP